MFSSSWVVESVRTFHWGLANSSCFVQTLTSKVFELKTVAVWQILHCLYIVLTKFSLSIIRVFPPTSGAGLAFGGKTWSPLISPTSFPGKRPRERDCNLSCVPQFLASWLALGPESRAFSYSTFFYCTLSHQLRCIKEFRAPRKAVIVW